ncbi:hypothetical protein HK28_07905 [Acetobacter sp. DsW_063]|nr:hypothetical protein HK28_07905 [Acetobacter sp. DsW_063]
MVSGRIDALNGDAPMADQLVSVGLLLAQADKPLTLTAGELRELGANLLDAGRQLRTAKASVRALSDELLEEARLPGHSAQIVDLRGVMA